MLEKIGEAVEAYVAKFGKMPEVVYMSESVFKQGARESDRGFALTFGHRLPLPDERVTIYGARVEIIPYPDNLLIVGGVRVNV